MSERGSAMGRRQSSNDTGGDSAAPGGHGAAPIVASLLAFFAAPTFATMALLSIVSQSGAGTCMAQDSVPLNGMAAMSLIVLVFGFRNRKRLYFGSV